MTHWDEFDFVIINDDIDVAVVELEAILLGEAAANRSDDPELRQKLKKILV
jgi:guanylate kinase